MKKMIIFILIAIFISSFAFADMDFASMSYDDLIYLQKSIVAEIMSRPEWKEVEVPAGRWLIGTDIPAGIYSIKSTRNFNTVQLINNNNDIAGLYQLLGEDESIGKIEMQDGLYFKCDRPVIFAPPAVITGF